MAYVYTFWGNVAGHEERLLYIGFSEAQKLETRLRSNRVLQTYMGTDNTTAVIRYVETANETDAKMLETYLINSENPFCNSAEMWQKLPTWFAPTFDDPAELPWQLWEKGAIVFGRYTSVPPAEVREILAKAKPWGV